MKIVFLDTMTLGNVEILEQFHTLGEVTCYPFTKPEDVVQRIGDAEIIVTNKVRIGAAEMKEAKQLKLICIAATGMNNVDLEAAKNNKIIVNNVKGYAKETVAQHTFAVLLHLLHQISFYDNFIKNGQYATHPVFTSLDREFTELSGKQIGIIGLGNIGKTVARIAKGFGMQIVYHSTSGKNLQGGFPHLSLEELLKTSHVVSIHAGLNAATEGLIDWEKIILMRRDAILINMGRGGIINEKDLAKAIDENYIKGAALDVFEKEPFPTDHPFLNMKEKDRLVLTPHIAWSAKEARVRMLQTIFEQIQEEKNTSSK